MTSSWASFASYFYANPENKGMKVDGQQVILDQNSLEGAIKKLRAVDKERKKPKDWGGKRSSINTKSDITKEFDLRMKKRRNMLDWDALYPDKDPKIISRHISCVF